MASRWEAVGSSRWPTWLAHEICHLSDSDVVHLDAAQNVMPSRCSVVFTLPLAASLRFRFRHLLAKFACTTALQGSSRTATESEDEGEGDADGAKKAHAPLLGGRSTGGRASSAVEEVPTPPVGNSGGASSEEEGHGDSGEVRGLTDLGCKTSEVV